MFFAGGAFAVGGSLAIEDAFALSLFLSSSLPPASLPIPSTLTPSPPTTPPSRRPSLSHALSQFSLLRTPHLQRVVADANAFRASKDRRNDLGLKMTEEEIRKAVLERVGTEWIGENDVEGQWKEMIAAEEEREGKKGC